ncbi:MAG TPA: transporter [Gemmatimonadaceae bacterium]
MLNAPWRVVRGNLAVVCASLALVGIDASRLHAQATQSTTPDTSQCPLIDADRPGIADGSHLIGAGQIQLETGYAQERHRDGDVPSRLSIAPTLLRIGLSQWVEARLEGNTFTHERVSPPDGSATTSNGFSPLFLGAKIALYDPKQSGPLQVSTIVRIAPPSGTDDFKSDRTTADVRLVANWQFTPTLSLNPNVGYGAYEGSNGTLVNTALGALTLSYNPTPRWNPFVDVAYSSREDAGGTWAMVADAGVAYIIGCNLQLDFSAGQNLHGVTSPKPFVAVGISVRADLLHRATHPFERLHGDRPAQSTRL